MGFGIGRLRWPRRRQGKRGALCVILYRRPYAAKSGHRLAGIEEVETALAAEGKPALAMAAVSAERAVFTRLFPLCVRHAVPLTLFVPTAAVSRSDDALTWGQIAEMVISGLVDVHFQTGREGAFPDPLAAALASPADLPPWPFGDAGRPDRAGLASLDEAALSEAVR